MHSPGGSTRRSLRRWWRSGRRGHDGVLERASQGLIRGRVQLPEELHERISGRIINEVRGIDRVVLDISSRPPAKIEWESGRCRRAHLRGVDGVDLHDPARTLQPRMRL
ncbi:MAG: hypothetical protein CMJ89_06155 [Planctomycetes bacterium]|nr:hypothetical protein [Planctomycetota bacterium]